jgi:hypothetical protein
MPVVEMQQKEFLTLHECAVVVGKTYGTIRNWILQKRIKADSRTVKGRTYFRVPLAEAERVKDRLERGLWA